MLAVVDVFKMGRSLGAVVKLVPSTYGMVAMKSLSDKSDLSAGVLVTVVE
jgi:hypothetical protein